MKTLAGYREMDHDLIQTGFIDWLLETNGLMPRLKVKEVSGNGIKYNIRTARGGSSWTQPNDTIVSTSGATEQHSAAIYSLIGQAAPDKFAMVTNSTQNPGLAEIKAKSTGFLWEWTERMVYGQNTTQSTVNPPKGLFTLVGDIEAEGTADLDGASGQNSQVIAKGQTGITNHDTSVALTLDMMDYLTDAVRLGVDAYVTTRRMRRKLTSLARATDSANLEHDNDQLGFPVVKYGGVPIYIVDALEDSLPDASSSVLTLSSYAIGTTRASGNDNSAIFALNLSEEGFVILQSGALRHEGPWTPDDLDAERHRFVWYTGFGLLNKFGAAVLINVLDAAL